MTEDPHWYRDAVIYQLHIKSFFDSNNDGIGDFAGLIDKLDYLSELGVDTLWRCPSTPPRAATTATTSRSIAMSAPTTARWTKPSASSGRRTSAACASSPSW